MISFRLLSSRSSLATSLELVIRAPFPPLTSNCLLKISQSVCQEFDPTVFLLLFRVFPPSFTVTPSRQEIASRRLCPSSSSFHLFFVSRVDCVCMASSLLVSKELCIGVSSQMQVSDNMALCSPADLVMPRSPAFGTQYNCICPRDSNHCSSARTQDASSQNHYSSHEPTCSFSEI